MNLTKFLGGLAVISLLAGCNKESQQGATYESADRESTVRSDSAGRLPDNTGVNERDRNDATLTAGDQGGSESDRKLTATIRQSLTSNDALSTTAKNIKIITVGGKVTLRGPVNSEAEKEAIANSVKQAGVESVDNQLEVKTTNP